MVLKDSTPILLIRGLTREQRHWGTFKTELAATLPNPVLSFDYAGTGDLYQLRSPGNIAGLRQSVQEQLLKAPEFNGKVHLVAISLGGMLAADWALQYPHQIASLTLINSSARSLSPFYQRLRWQNYVSILRGAFMGAAKREQMILQLTSAKPAEHASVVTSWQQWQQQRPVSKLNALRQLWAASRFMVKPLPQRDILLLSSRGDKLVSPQCSSDLARYWQAPHIQHPWAGHDLPLDDASWLCAQLAAFISQQN
ncbi:alpha/beta hydrolase [Rheinheimera baltica]|uniref:Alpha/beta hydrolase n=1 Tax=Rheinheimera baltica TaxID=67576 RepID=A0ABT9HZ83_9GAMM|nr:alpha/beta hydrolase [Rheinheimera baltica]MDP5136427.1 alpha/beta hydrolase [Rheinheimera baltica]